LYLPDKISDNKYLANIK